VQVVAVCVVQAGGECNCLYAALVCVERELSLGRTLGKKGSHGDQLEVVGPAADKLLLECSLEFHV
jgi:hypothetical protein